MSISEFVATTVHVPFDETTFRNPTFSNSYLELHPTTQGCRPGSLSPQPFVCRWTKQLFTTRLIQLVTKTTSHNRRMSISEVVATSVHVPFDQTTFCNPRCPTRTENYIPQPKDVDFGVCRHNRPCTIRPNNFSQPPVIQLVSNTSSHNPGMSISEFVTTAVHVQLNQTHFSLPA